LASWRSRHGSAYPVPDPHQNVMDPQSMVETVNTRGWGEWRDVCQLQALQDSPRAAAAEGGKETNPGTSTQVSIWLLDKANCEYLQRVCDILVVDFRKKMFAFGQCFGSGSGLDPGSIKSVDPYPDPGGKNYPQKLKIAKKLRNFLLWILFLGLKAFFCNLDVLFGGLGICKLQFLKKKYIIFFSAKFLVIKILDPDWIRIQIGVSLKCWIRVRNKRIPTDPKHGFWFDWFRVLTSTSERYLIKFV
jgi:hypothetical protein